jgi:hypothetical protein
MVIYICFEQSSSSQQQQQQQQQRPQESIDKIFDTAITAGGASLGGGENWPGQGNDMPKIVSLDVKCEKNSMKVYLGFDKPFYGIVFSKGHYSNANCVHLPAGLGRTSVNFEISIHACGTAGNTENGLYGYGTEVGSGTYFENIVVIQYDPQVGFPNGFSSRLHGFMASWLPGSLAPWLLGSLAPWLLGSLASWPSFTTARIDYLHLKLPCKQLPHKLSRSPARTITRKILLL